MTIKEAIGKFKAPQLVCRYHQMCMLGSPRPLIKACRSLAQDFDEGNFQIVLTGFVGDGSEKFSWMVKPNLKNEDTATANKVVVKVEGAMGFDYNKQPVALLKLTTDDDMVYYYDGEDRLTTRKWTLQDVSLKEDFFPIEL